ncbi:MAG TPA: electron transfer flavoprotein subunit beta/FixA family protein [Dehalococcoidia bacterium]|nr:electron transfer flavoprotein subunit beta/FixA family protein [Dehalococcoidia bacterium]
MRIVICAKEVLDPDAVNAYAVAGRLQIAEDGRTVALSAIPSLMNAYDEQAIEAALRIKEAGVECTITVVAVGSESSQHLKRAAALGVDELAIVPLDLANADGLVVGNVLAAFIRSTGGADLVLCGRQASDDDQGVVPPVIGELLGFPIVTMARDISVNDGAVRVVRVTPNGDETVEAALPAVVTVSSELGVPRFPTAAGMMAARKMKPRIVPLAELALDEGALAPRAKVERMFVPTVQGNCEFIDGSAEEVAQRLIERLRSDGVLP